MLIATWNVNSLRVRLGHLSEWLAANAPDIVALQETKVEDPSFPVKEIMDCGYTPVFSGQKTYNGVAILAKLPAQDVVTDADGLEDSQRRILAASFGDVRVVNLYVPNGSEVGSLKYAYKLDWLEKVHAWLAAELLRHPKLVVLGDFNIAPADEDVYDPVRWKDKILCSTPERDAFKGLLDLGLSDTFRHFEQAERSFTWWDYRMNGFARNLGLRIDHILASSALMEQCDFCRVDLEPRKLERPSDHAPVLAGFGG